MGTWSTPHNNTGRVINGSKLVNLQNYIERTAGVFGLTITGIKTPTALDPVNVDALRIEIEHLVKTAKNGNREGSIMKFVQKGNSLGVQFSVGPTIVSSVTGLAVTNEGLLTADIDWDAYVPNDGGTVTYDVQIWDTDANPDVLELTGSDLPFATYNPALNSQTGYKARVRAKWNNGESMTPWSDYVTFSTLNQDAPAGLAVGSITDTTASASWDAKVITGFSVTYDIEIRLDADDSVIFSSYGQAGVSAAVTGLTTATAYYAVVRAKWTDGAVKTTAYSAEVPFTTL